MMTFFICFVHWELAIKYVIKLLVRFCPPNSLALGAMWHCSIATRFAADNDIYAKPFFAFTADDFEPPRN